jgi:hypothetical protein
MGLVSQAATIRGAKSMSRDMPVYQLMVFVVFFSLVFLTLMRFG